jgi:hypothetical protein
MNPFVSFVIFVVQAVAFNQTWPFRISALQNSKPVLAKYRKWDVARGLSSVPIKARAPLKPPIPGHRNAPHASGHFGM